MSQRMPSRDSGTDELKRFTFSERLVHWVVGVTFVVLLLTGLAFSHPRLFWITNLFGGGTTARVIHPWIGLVFSVGLGFMFFLWLRDMHLSRADADWLRKVRHYAVHRKEDVPPTGKYNAGQKLFFWLMTGLGIVHLVTGVPIWFPEGALGMGPFGRGTLTSMRMIHYVTTVGGGLLLIVHVYLGTFLYPGTARGILQGTVSRSWARLHHPLWEKEETGS